MVRDHADSQEHDTASRGEGVIIPASFVSIRQGACAFCVDGVERWFYRKSGQDINDA